MIETSFDNFGASQLHIVCSPTRTPISRDRQRECVYVCVFCVYTYTYLMLAHDPSQSVLLFQYLTRNFIRPPHFFALSSKVCSPIASRASALLLQYLSHKIIYIIYRTCCAKNMICFPLVSQQRVLAYSHSCIGLLVCLRHDWVRMFEFACPARACARWLVLSLLLALSCTPSFSGSLSVSLSGFSLVFSLDFALLSSRFLLSPSPSHCLTHYTAFLSFFIARSRASSLSLFPCSGMIECVSMCSFYLTLPFSLSLSLSHIQKRHSLFLFFFLSLSLSTFCCLIF